MMMTPAGQPRYTMALGKPVHNANTFLNSETLTYEVVEAGLQKLYTPSTPAPTIAVTL